MSPPFALEIGQEGVAVLRLRNPPLNVLDVESWSELDRITSQLHREKDVRAVVVTGGERHFGAGANVTDMAEMTAQEFRAANLVLQGAINHLAKAPQVVVAAINGVALGGGCELALAADFRFAAEDSVFGLPEITLGLIPGSGGTQRLQRLVGLSMAKDMIFSGRQVSAEEALRIGLVDKLFAPSDVLDNAMAYANKFAKGPYALSMAKRAIDVGAGMSIDEALAVESELIVQCFASEDGQMGLKSFLAEGPGKAQFTGR